MSSRLALGSAQWGMRYGVANRSGRPPLDQLREMLQTAWESGIRTIDTAQAYGEAERVIGQVARRPWEVVTKVHPAVTKATALDEAIAASYRKLRRDYLDVALFHRPEQYQDAVLWRRLQKLKEQGRVGQIGVSVASVDQADAVLDGVDAIQVSASLLDQRLVHSGFFARAHHAEVRVFVRSIFLQGAALLPCNRLRHHLAPLRDPLAMLDTWGRDRGRSLLEVLVTYARDRFHADIVVGTETPAQIVDLVEAWGASELDDDEMAELEAIVPPFGEQLLNPLNWPSR